MTWALLDDEFYAHPKVVSVGNAGAGLYARALSYCGAHLTDGLVPEGWAREAGGRALCSRLVDAGLWDRVEGGFQIPDYTQYNPTRETVMQRRSELSQKRSVAGKRGARARWSDGKPDGKRDSKTHGNEGGNEMAPYPNPSSSEAKASSRQPDMLWDALIDELGPPATESERGKRNSALKELRQVGATPEEVHRRSAAYRKKWPDMELTAKALTGNWTMLGRRVDGLEVECPECGSRFKGERTLAAHRKNVHGVEPIGEAA